MCTSISARFYSICLEVVRLSLHRELSIETGHPGPPGSKRPGGSVASGARTPQPTMRDFVRWEWVANPQSLGFPRQ